MDSDLPMCKITMLQFRSMWAPSFMCETFFNFSKERKKSIVYLWGGEVGAEKSNY